MIYIYTLFHLSKRREFQIKLLAIKPAPVITPLSIYLIIYMSKALEDFIEKVISCKWRFHVYTFLMMFLC